MTLPAGASAARPVGGGDINEAFRVVLADGSDAFVKTRPGAAPGEYAAEAAGLEWLAEPGALRTPRVLAVDDGYLALEWVDAGRLEDAGAEELGRGLARIHFSGADAFGAFDALGGSSHARFGSLQLPNDPTAEWPSFYAQRRLRPLASIAGEREALSPSGLAAVETVCERLPELAGPPEAPARLHGDLWSGNVMADAGGRPVLIDPSAYGGHREVDLAMLRLFGAPSRAFFDAYEESAAPLADGHAERVDLYQLLPLLVHAVLFGGGYGAQVESAARRY